MSGTNIVLSSGSDSVTLECQDIEENFDKSNMLTITPAKAVGKQDTGPRDTIIVDLQRNEHRLTVTGKILTGDKPTIVRLFSKKNNITLTWTEYYDFRETGTKTGSDTCVIQRMSIRRMATDEIRDTDVTENEYYHIVISMIIGSKFGSS